MTPEQIQQLIDRLFWAGQTMGSAAWDLAMRQAVLSGFVNLGLAAMCVVASILFIKSVSWLKKTNVDDPESMYIVAAAAVVFAIIFVFAGAARLYNPGWYAIEMLLKLIP